MRTTRLMSAAALALAASSVVAKAQTVSSVFNENYDDGNASSRWTFLARENNVDPAVTTPDATVNWAFDYSNVKYESNNGPVGQFTVPIPAAPGGGGMKAVQIHVNDGGAPTNIVQAVIMPAAASLPAGGLGTDFIVKTDMFLNYNAPAAGSGSTESYMLGLNANPDLSATTGRIAGDNLNGGGFDANKAGVGYAFEGSSDGDNNGDYRVYTRNIPNFTDDGPSPSKKDATWTGTSRQYVLDGTGTYTGVQVLPGEANGAAGNGTTIPYRGFANANTYYRDEVLPNSQGFEVAGVVGKHWVTAQYEQHGKIALYTLNGKIINHLFLPANTALTGSPELGLVDGTAGQPDDTTDSYILYDNTSITKLNAAAANTIPAGATYITANAGGTVTADGAATINGLTMDTTSTTLAGTGTLQLGTTTVANGDYGAIWAGQGNHVISKPVRFAADTAVYVDAATDTLKINSLTTDPNIDFNKAGLGTLTVPAGFTTKSITVNLGAGSKLALSGSGSTKTTILSLEQQPAFNASFPLSTSLGTLDFGRSMVAIDYPNAPSASGVALPLSPLGYVALYIGNAADLTIDPSDPDPTVHPTIFNAAWDRTGLTTSAPEVQGTGYHTSIYTVRNSEASALGYADGSTWMGKTIDATTVLFGFTFKADSNLDQTVNFTDLLTLAKNYNKTVDDSSYTSWMKGDSNEDGKVDFADLLALAKNYNQTVGSGTPAADAATFAADWALAQALAPEPATLGALLGLSSLALGRRRR